MLLLWLVDGAEQEVECGVEAADPTEAARVPEPEEREVLSRQWRRSDEHINRGK